MRPRRAAEQKGDLSVPERSKRSLSSTREKQSPKLSKTVCRPTGAADMDCMHLLISGNVPDNYLGEKLVLPKVKLQEKLLTPRDPELNTNIFKHRVVKRTTVTSIKRTTIANSRVIRPKVANRCEMKDMLGI